MKFINIRELSTGTSLMLLKWLWITILSRQTMKESSEMSWLPR
ncbi:MAG: hypothetical protein [Olavius algarvensis Gamma 1 endosymbiont]|nr:MAG: hypothetical protein [Olavius algarvensis Gamma 1 endosymbiont]